MAPRKVVDPTLSAAAAAMGQRGGLASAKRLSKKARSERARHAALARTPGTHAGWPKGKPRTPKGSR